MSVKFDHAGVYGVKYLPLLRNGHGRHHVVGTLTNIEQDKAVPQVSKAEQMFARLFENMKTRQAPLQVGEVSYVGPAPSQRSRSRDVPQLPRSSCWA